MLSSQYCALGRGAVLLRPATVSSLEAEGFASHLYGRSLFCESLLGATYAPLEQRFAALSTDTTNSKDEPRGRPDSAVTASPSLAASSDASDTRSDSKDDVFEYHGPFSNALKRVKGLSIASLGITMVGSPLLLALHGDPSMTLGAKAGIAGTLTGFGVFTTGLLHWFAAPYVHNLKYNRTTGMIDVETLSFFLQQRFARFHVSEVGPTDSLSPVSTFQAKGVTYYVDGDNFADKELLDKLAPPAEDPAGKDESVSATNH